jgi:hypothetical protein
MTLGRKSIRQVQFRPGILCSATKLASEMTRRNHNVRPFPSIVSDRRARERALFRKLKVARLRGKLDGIAKPRGTFRATSDRPIQRRQASPMRHLAAAARMAISRPPRRCDPPLRPDNGGEPRLSRHRARSQAAQRPRPGMVFRKFLGRSVRSFLGSTDDRGRSGGHLCTLCQCGRLRRALRKSQHFQPRRSRQASSCFCRYRMALKGARRLRRSRRHSHDDWIFLHSRPVDPFSWTRLLRLRQIYHEAGAKHRDHAVRAR